MSMISSLIDKLRQMADGQVTYRDARVVMLQAADTIWQLRDDLQRANADNAKLLEELADAPKCETCEAMLDCDECLRADGSHKERRRLKAENDKLREDVDRLIQAVEDLHDVSLEDKLVQMENENDKLQNNADLLRAMWSQVNTEKRCYMAENAKLREQIHWLKRGDILHVLTDQEYIDQCERERLMQVSIDALDKENAKLRELVKSMYYDLTHMTFPPDWVTDYEADMRELGVEVDGC